MKRALFLFIGFSLLLIQSLSSQMIAGLNDENKHWYACKSVRECTFERSYCGEPIGVNRQYLQNFQEWYATIRYRCEKIQRPPVDSYCVSCQKNTCHVETHYQKSSKKP